MTTYRWFAQFILDRLVEEDEFASLSASVVRFTDAERCLILNTRLSGLEKGCGLVLAVVSAPGVRDAAEMMEHAVGLGLHRPAGVAIRGVVPVLAPLVAIL